jgi:hypothetical protein
MGGMERQLAAVAGLALVLAFLSPQGGSATIVKAAHVAIETHGANLSARSFSMTYRARPTAAKRDGGAAKCIFEIAGTGLGARGERRRTLSGTEVLTSSTGALTLRWTAVQAQSHGRWGELSGRWRVVAAAGVYAGNSGRGELRATGALETIDYYGVLVTAQ